MEHMYTGAYTGPWNPYIMFLCQELVWLFLQLSLRDYVTLLKRCLAPFNITRNLNIEGTQYVNK